MGQCGSHLGYVAGGKAYGISRDMWEGYTMWLTVEGCVRIWRHVAVCRYVAGCGGIWLRWLHAVVPC